MFHLDPHTIAQIVLAALTMLTAAFHALKAFFDRSRDSRSSTRRLPTEGTVTARRVKDARRAPRSGAKRP